MVPSTTKKSLWLRLVKHNDGGCQSSNTPVGPYRKKHRRDWVGESPAIYTRGHGIRKVERSGPSSRWFRTRENWQLGRQQK